jgi:hypothetical protein
MSSEKEKGLPRRLGVGCLLALLCVTSVAGQALAPASSDQGVQAALQRAIAEIRGQPAGYEEYDYIMTARVRLLLFWAGADDVGGGYIRRGASPEHPSADMFQLVMGSDPAKAPRAINRWGAAWELASHGTIEGNAPEPSMFFGFMKVSSGTSLSAMQKELSQEKRQGSKFLFSATIGEASPNGSISKVMPFPSDQDFTIHQLDQATPAVFDRLAEPGGELRSVDATQVRACGRSEGFLSSVSDLINGSLEGGPLPGPLCYLFNGERFTLRLTEVTRVPLENVELSLHEEPHRYVRTYHDLLLEHFENFNETTKKESSFELLLGTTGRLRGVPLRISYQPNWWFQVVLNMRTPETSESASNR